MLTEEFYEDCAEDIEVFQNPEFFRTWLQDQDPDTLFWPNYDACCPIGSWYWENFGTTFLSSPLYAGRIDNKTTWYQDYYWRAVDYVEEVDDDELTWTPEEALAVLDEVEERWWPDEPHM
jgi:hypothetical protein